MIYDEEKILINLVKTNLYNKINNYNIIILLDDTIILNSKYEELFYYLLNKFNKLTLFTINSDIYLYLEQNDIFLINNILCIHNCKFSNYYSKLNDIYNKVCINNSILIMYIHNISVDDFGINNMDRFSNYIYNIIDNIYVYIILLENDIKKIYNYYFNHKNITIINYEQLEINDNLIYIFNNLL